LLNTFTKKQHSPDTDMSIRHESHAHDTTLYPFANYTRRPAFTTSRTMPGHAISDMDRDIKLQTVNHSDLRELEAAISWMY
jgi:hypothetical protein